MVHKIRVEIDVSNLTIVSHLFRRRMIEATEKTFSERVGLFVIPDVITAKTDKSKFLVSIYKMILFLFRQYELI